MRYQLLLSLAHLSLFKRLFCVLTLGLDGTMFTWLTVRSVRVTIGISVLDWRLPLV